VEIQASSLSDSMSIQSLDASQCGIVRFYDIERADRSHVACSPRMLEKEYKLTTPDPGKIKF
jgi:hypothetical protein